MNRNSTNDWDLFYSIGLQLAVILLQGREIYSKGKVVLRTHDGSGGPSRSASTSQWLLMDVHFNFQQLVECAFAQTKKVI